MGSAFVVLGAFYRPAIGEPAAIAKAAVHIELPTMGVAIPLYHRAGIAALQPEVGPRGGRRGEAGRESERGGRNGQFHVPTFPLTKDVKPERRPAIYNALKKAGRGASHFWKVASEPCVGCPITLRTPAAVPGFYARARRLALAHPVRVKKPSRDRC
jgi:hypothetical protein